VGLWITSVDFDIKEPLPEFWKLAREAREHTVKGIPHAIEYAGMLDYIRKDKWEEHWNRQRSLTTNGKSSTLGISNLGIWEAPTHFGNLNVLGCVFSQGSNVVGALVQINVVTLNSKLQLSVSYSPNLLTQQQMQQFVNDFKRELQIATTVRFWRNKR